MKYFYSIALPLVVLTFVLVFASCKGKEGDKKVDKTICSFSSMNAAQSIKSFYGTWHSVNHYNRDGIGNSWIITFEENTIELRVLGVFDVVDVFHGTYHLCKEVSIESGSPMPEGEKVSGTYIKAELTSDLSNETCTISCRLERLDNGLLRLCLLTKEQGHNDLLEGYLDSCLMFYTDSEDAVYPIKPETENWILPIAKCVFAYGHIKPLSLYMVYPEMAAEEESIKAVDSEDYTYYEVSDVSVGTKLSIKMFKVSTNVNIVAVVNGMINNNEANTIDFYEVNLSKHTLKAIDRPFEPKDYALRVADAAYQLQPNSKDIIIRFTERGTKTIMKWNGEKFIAEE